MLRDITDVLSAAGAGILSAVLNKIEEDKCGSNNFCVSLVIHDVTASMVTREDSHRLGIELVDTDLGDKNIAGSPANILWLIGAKQDELQATNGKADNVPKLTVLTSPLIQIGLGLGRPSSDYPRIISEPNKIPFTEAIVKALQGFGDIVDVNMEDVELGIEVAEHRARDTIKVVEAITLKFLYRALCTTDEALAGCGFQAQDDMYVLRQRPPLCLDCLSCVSLSADYITIAHLFVRESFIRYVCQSAVFLFRLWYTGAQMTDMPSMHTDASSPNPPNHLQVFRGAGAG